MDENKKMAFDAALDLVRQLITLASGILALTATFLKDVLSVFQGKDAALPHPHWTLYVTWILMLLSILFGLLAHGAITGNLDQIDLNSKDKKGKDEITIYKQNIVKLTTAQWVSFFFGAISLIIFASITISQNK
jgi:hypothetical protein